MGPVRYKSEELRNLRAPAAELAASLREFGEGFEAAAAAGDSAAARRILEQATLKIKQYEELRAQLGPDGVFLAKYGVEVINDHTVLFTLPAGCSRIEVLNEAQELTKGRDLIRLSQLAKWSKDERWTSRLAASERICIDGHVQHAQTREQQIAFLNQRGLRLPSQEDLSVAFALHWVATESSLFRLFDESAGRSYHVRAAAGMLYFNRFGLNVDDTLGDSAHIKAASSARISLE